MFKRLLVFSLILFVAAFAFAQQAAPKPAELTTTKLADNLYTLTGSGGNMAFLVTDEGVLLVDAGTQPIAAEIRAAIKSVTDKPIKYIFITHHHHDHVASLAQLSKDAPVLAQENTYKRIAGQAPQAIAFSDQMCLHMGGKGIRFIHPLASGHTDGDGVVWFVKENVVHMGDELFAGMFPYMDLDAGGNVLSLADSVDKVVAMVPPDTKFIPGHGPIYTAAQMKEYTAFLRDTAELVRAAIKQGKTLDQMKAENVLAKYEKMSNFVKTPQFTEWVYKSVQAKDAAAAK